MIASFSISIILFRSAGVSLEDFSDVEDIHQINRKLKKTIDDEGSFNIQDIDSINVSTVSSDVRFIPEDRNDVRVHFHGSIASNKEVTSPELIAEIQNKVLKIKIDPKSSVSFGFYSSNIDLDIYIPNEYSKSIDVKTTSADINLGSLDIKDISVSSVSGDIEAESLYTEKSSFESTSGEIELKDFSGKIDAETTAGDVFINFKVLKDYVDIHSTSGGIELVLPHNSGFYLESKSTSGDIECDFPISLEGKLSDKNIRGRVGQEKNKIVLSTVSGDIEISKNRSDL